MTRRRLQPTLLLITLALLCILPFSNSIAQTPTPPAPEYTAGLKLSFAAPNAPAPIDSRIARLIALHIPAASPPCPSLPAGPFSATWEGVLTSHSREPQVFSAEGTGDFQLKINDALVLDLHGTLSGHPSQPIQLKRGKNQILATYKSPAQGDASIRLQWSLQNQPADPINPMVFTHDAADPQLKDRIQISRGRTLVATLNCVKCHKADTGENAMPELNEDAPSFSGINSRLKSTWLAYWITNPKALRPTASMPRVFHDTPASADPDVNQNAADIAAYLAPRSTDQLENTIPSDPTTLVTGTRLFTGLGCIACHASPDVEDSDPTLKRVPLKYVKTKFYTTSLKAFLLKPEEHYAWSKMPNFHLTDVEATQLTAYLWNHSKNDALPPLKLSGDPQKGKQLVESAGCLSCHSNNSTPVAIDLAKADFTKGCLADAPSPKSPDYAFTPNQRLSIRAFAAKDLPTLAHDTPIDFKSRQMTLVRCNACHGIDDKDDQWSSLDQEVGTIEKDLAAVDANPNMAGDQLRPPLTWLGDRLRPEFIEAQLTGTVPFKTRYWLTARMPAFPARAKQFAIGMAEEHGVPPVSEPPVAVDPKLSAEGQTLCSAAVAGCVQCHGIAAQAPLAPYNGQAPNLSHVSTRLRHEYYTRWMRKPNYYLPGTKMPQFRAEDGTTTYKTIENGDADKQFEAIWHYLQTGDKITPPQ